MNSKAWTIAVIVLILLGGWYFVSNSQRNKVIAPAAQIILTPTKVIDKQSTSSGEMAVNVTNNGFDPATVTVKIGTKVTWMNKNSDSVIIASDPHPLHTDYPPLNLGSLGAGQSASLVFNKQGSYSYHNHLNPSEIGKVIVQ